MSNIQYKDGIVDIDGTRYETSLDKNFLERKPYQAPNTNLIKNQIPGTVNEICVQAGDQVKAGQKLAVFVAMKMHNVILAHKSGVIKSVGVSVGDSLPKGQVMFEIE